MFSPPRIRDARGTSVTLVPYEFVGPLAGDPAKRQRLERAGWSNALIEPERRTVRVLCAWIGVGGIAMWALLHACRRWDLPAWLGAATPVAVVLTFAFATEYILRRMEPAKIVRVYLKAGYCASCSYDLVHIAPDEDRATTCPECGAAWRLDARGSDARPQG